MESEPDSLFKLVEHSLFLFSLPSFDVIASFSVIFILLLLSALVSGSEVAFFSLGPNNLQGLKKEDKPSGNRILQLLKQPRKLLATILIANNFINIGIVILSAFVLDTILPATSFDAFTEKALSFLHLDNTFNPDKVAQAISFLITVVGVTFILVLFGEIAPKVYARINKIGLSRLMATPLWVLMKVFHPLSTILVSWTTSIEKRLEKRRPGGSLTSREDIDEAIDLTADGTESSSREIELLKRIVKFGEVSVTQIMRPRVDVIAVDISSDYKQLLEIVRDSSFSRIPVFEKDFDNVKGILYVKDLLGHLNEAEDFVWQERIRKNVLFVPESKKIDALLKDFQREHMHMTIIVDEYGGSSGIVTMEDILEEIIGDIQDEFDNEPEIDFRKINESVYIFEGKTLLNDFCRQVKIETTTFDDIKGDADTLAGIILEELGRLPEKEEEVRIKGFSFKIVKVNSRRIEQIRVELPK